MKRFIMPLLLSLATVFLLFSMQGCASLERDIKTHVSDWSGGLYRILNVYDYQGNLIASYTGKIDIQSSQSKVLFDLDGKRYVYYNFPVEVIELDEPEVQ